MTITNKITLVVGATLLVLCSILAVTEFVMNLTFLRQELEIHANNTLHNLGLALIPILETGDVEKSELFFSSVLTQDNLVDKVTLQWAIDGKLQSWDYAMNEADIVPEWFASLVFLEPIWHTTTIKNGWTELAVLSITVSPTHANAALWELTSTFAIYSAFIIGIATLVVRLTLKRMLSPISLMTKEAKRIAKLDFSGGLPTSKYRDLSALTYAFNDMSSQLQSLFETLSEEINTLRTKYLFDEGSGLPNRSFLTRQIESWLSDGDCGVLMMINLKWLEGINPSQGTKSLNDCLRSLGRSFENILPASNDAVAARLGKAEIAILIPSVHERQARSILGELIRAINAEIIGNGMPIANGFTIGVAEKNQDDTLSSLLERANSALIEAEKEQKVFSFSLSEKELSQDEIDTKLKEAIKANSFQFSVQPIFATTSKEIEHYEVFTKIEVNGDYIPASKLISDLSRLSLATSFDRAVVNHSISVLDNNGHFAPFSVNLTADSIKDPEFISWLTSTLTVSKLKHRLSFEFAEAIACHNPKNCEAACRALREAGVRYGIDRFGQHLASVSYLRSLNPDFVKLDHSFMLHSNDDSNHLLLKPMIKMASSLGIDVIASAVEYKQQLKRFSDTRITAYYGFISPPEPLDALQQGSNKIA
ncbi:EAL domain-containing protein [Grimontia kaedaensis]|uniref:EAL domain-containing protein n=1 Tax=Grimontia kaedaensis TaxID=2872157 RepID=A0ABY4WNI9_9GAMM|nr:EAL domain-containing protein [Grimontia kaedaensis]USH01148.1 EAL domain-containing protein [Grimontia kaedaensis]